MIEKIDKSMDNLVDSLLDYSVGISNSNDDLEVKEYLDIVSLITQNMKRLFDMGISVGTIIPKNNNKIPQEEVGEIK